MTYHATGRPPGRPSKQQEVVNWLQEYVNSGAGGMRLATGVEAAGKERGYNLVALKRAKKVAGFTSIRVGGLGSDGDWMWANPRMLSQDQSITQELAEKIDRYEKRIAETAVTSKAQSRARIANGWLRQITEELFDNGKTLAEIREDAAKQDPYLSVKDFADIEDEFQQAAISRLMDLEKTRTAAEAAYEAIRSRLANAVATGKTKLAQAEAEMQQAETAKAQALELAKRRLDRIAEQVGVVMFRKLTTGQQAA